VLFLHRTVRLIILRVADLGAITSIEAKVLYHLYVGRWYRHAGGVEGRVGWCRSQELRELHEAPALMYPIDQKDDG